MENKSPKELWIGFITIKLANTNIPKSNEYIVKESQHWMTDQKYLHISEVERQLAEKQTEIDNLIKLVAEHNAEIAEKDKLFNVFVSYEPIEIIAAEDSKVENISFYDFNNKAYVQYKFETEMKAGHSYIPYFKDGKVRLEDITPIEQLKQLEK